jgi:hypothetical protein
MNDALRLNLRCNPLFEKDMITFLGSGIATRIESVGADCPGKALARRLSGNPPRVATRPHKVRMEYLGQDAEPWLSMQIEHADDFQHAKELIVDDKLAIRCLSQCPQVERGVMGFPKHASFVGYDIEGDVAQSASGRADVNVDGVGRDVAFTPPLLIFGNL